MIVEPNLKRWFAFLIGCIGIRLLFVIGAKFASESVLKLMGYGGLIISIVFGYLWLTNSRQQGFEAGGKIWWANWRIIHSILYFGFAIAAINNNRNAYMYLAIDVLVGLVLFFTHYRFGLPN